MEKKQLEKLANFIKNYEEEHIGFRELSENLVMNKTDTKKLVRDYIIQYLQDHPEGVSITDISTFLKMNRNWVAKILEMLLISGVIDKRVVGPAKLFHAPETTMTKWEKKDKFYQALIENTADLIGVFQIKPNQVIHFKFLSPSVKRIIDIDEKEIDMDTIKSMIHENDLSGLLKIAQKMRENKNIKEINEFFRIKGKNGKWLQLDISIQDQTSNPAIKGYVFTAHNITNLINLEQQIQFQLIFEQFILDLAETLIRIPKNEIFNELNRTISLIGRFLINNQHSIENLSLGADRIHIFLYSKDKKTISNTHEWLNEDIEPQIDKLKEISSDTLSWWNENIINNQVIYIKEIKELPKNANGERKILKMQNIKSSIILPLNKKRKFSEKGDAFGFICFDFVVQTAVFSDMILKLLKTCSVMISSALIRYRRKK